MSVKRVGAVVLAAGMSARMGQPKQLMLWGDKPMARHVVDVLLAGGVESESVVVVVGHEHEKVEESLKGSGAKIVLNPQYADGSMLRSLQVGLSAIQSVEFLGGPPPEAVLVALSDQPQIKAEVAQAVIARWRDAGGEIVAPKFEDRRGHPILFAVSIWPEILAAVPVGSPRDMLGVHSERIVYAEAGDDSVLRDIDTPDDYRRETERRV
ncbi:MAG: nucleotidyltransferase family protein [Chloroflexi bacterium]|nr:nucleotidyltransferase family protein [Chloroflexota bacterium]